VVGLVGGTVSAGAKSAGHALALGITSAVMFGMFGYILWTSKRRFGSHLKRFGPSYLVLAASFFVIVDPGQNVLGDIGVWDAPDSLDPLFQACTYTGFALLTIGTLWNANIAEKIKDFRAKWRELREEN